MLKWNNAQRLRGATFEIQLSFYVWDLWIKLSPFVHSKTFYQTCLCKNKTKTFFFSFIFLETKFTKLQWLTWKTHRVMFEVSSSYSSIINQNNDLKSSKIYNAVGVLITWLNMRRQTARNVINTCLFFISWSLLMMWDLLDGFGRSINHILHGLFYFYFLLTCW